jgi:hypothetical protein
MRPIGCPETPVNKYKHKLRNNPEEQRPSLIYTASIRNSKKKILCTLAISCYLESLFYSQVYILSAVRTLKCDKDTVILKVVHGWI